MNFVARQMELNLLDDLYRRSGAQLLILYGRRRIGKTRLVSHWLSQIEGQHLYWMATQTSAVNQLRNFSQALFQFLNPGAAIDPTFSYASWSAALTEAGRIAQSNRLVLVLDEFTYVMQAEPEVPSLIQQIWDHQLKEQSNLFLILTGSLAGIIQRTALDYQSPLYGRATASLRLQPLPFGALAGLLPQYQPEQRVAVYAVTGGIPGYLELFDDRLTILENLRQRIVTPANVMLTDAVFLLHEQLDEPRNYMAIIEAIAAGYHTLSDIAKMAGIVRSNIVKYLGVLRELGYVGRIVPVTVRRPEQSRQGRYVIVDPYLRFYFRFLAPNWVSSSGDWSSKPSICYTITYSTSSARIPLRNCAGSGWRCRGIVACYPCCRSGLAVSGQNKPRLTWWLSTGAPSLFCWESVNGAKMRLAGVSSGH